MDLWSKVSRYNSYLPSTSEMDPQKDNQPQTSNPHPPKPQTTKNCLPTRIQAWMDKNPQKVLNHRFAKSSRIMGCHQLVKVDKPCVLFVIFGGRWKRTNHGGQLWWCFFVCWLVGCWLLVLCLLFLVCFFFCVLLVGCLLVGWLLFFNCVLFVGCCWWLLLLLFPPNHWQ